MLRSFLKQLWSKISYLNPKLEENLGDESSIIHLMNEVIPQNLGIQSRNKKTENLNERRIKVS